jgi:hypothetical protein
MSGILVSATQFLLNTGQIVAWLLLAAFSP